MDSNRVNMEWGSKKCLVFNRKVSALLISLQILAQAEIANLRANAETTEQGVCQQKISANNADLDSLKIYPELHFKAKWTRDYKHFWKSTEFDFESRYIKETKHRAKSQNHHHSGPPQVKAFVLPFSHNDPGWKETYEVYFYSLTKKILTNAVTKLIQHKNMTFAWSEISFLSKWWDEASQMQKEALQRLVKEGRLEILTGGWVMADEATTTTFGLVNELAIGHQWIQRHLNVFPKSGWSIDAFGHSSTMPYLLNKVGIKGMMIQRVHYAWKHWFAEHRQGDFFWVPRWSHFPERDGILCHNAHYDLYPTKHSCGPNPNICMRFDFRVLDGIREEHLNYVHQVEKMNIVNLADFLTGQYRRTASLTEHNVVLASLGGDFRFEHNLEWDQQYSNYNLLFDHINSRRKEYNMAVKFGTLSNYFEAVKDSNKSLSTFAGDFFPYTDVIFPFAPGYWTGYYSTRPFWKKLGREAEDELVKAEILFSFSYNLLRQRNHSFEILYRNYDNLVHARQSVALFQHHDGCTATSPRATMLDYARKLSQAWNFCRQIQRLAIESIWKSHLNIGVPPLVSETERNSYTKPLERLPIRLFENANIVKKVIIFNNLPWERSQLVRLMVSGEIKQNIVVKDPSGDSVVAQINSGSTLDNTFELLFQAELPGLSVVTYEINSYNDDEGKHARKDAASQSVTSCKTCRTDDRISSPIMSTKKITLNNGKIKVDFDTDLGLLKRIETTSESGSVKANVTLSFGRYEAIFGSGAYLLHPYTSSTNAILNDTDVSIYVVHGSVTSEVITVSPKYTLRSWILHGGSPEAMSVVYMTFTVNGTSSDGFGEYFMRFQTDLNNTEVPSATVPFHEKPRPVLFTDTNGLSVEKRVSLSKLPYQANHFPITQFAFIQDVHKNLRLSLLTDRSHGVSSVIRGRLETIFDRRLRYDDARGMDEGVLDTETAITNYIITLENIPFTNDNHFSSWQPSLQVQKLSKYLNHQPTIFLYDALSSQPNAGISLFSQNFPDDVHLLNMQTLSDSKNQEDIKSVPSATALLILQRLSHYNNTNQPSNLGTFTKKHCTHRGNILNATININHYVKKTNLVGTIVLGDKNDNFVKMSVGEPHELSAYLIYF